MASKKGYILRTNRLLLIGFLCIIFGSVATYFLITATNVMPLNYQQKFDQVYNAQERERGWDTFVDLVNGFTINYPERFRPNSGAYAYPGGAAGGLLHMGNATENLLYSSQITFMRTKESTNNILNFVRNDDPLYTPGMTLKNTTFKGDPAVIADFTMNEKLHKEINTFYSLNTHRELEPVGYKDRRIFILHKGYVYRLSSGSLFADTEVERFEKILNSLTFIH